MGKISKKLGHGHIDPSQSLCILLLTAFIFSGPTAWAASKSSDEKNCNIQQGSCTQNLSGRKITLEIQPRPVKAMNELTFRVTLTGRKLASNPYIDLGMPGMDMGPNRVHLKRVDKRVYEGLGIIVRCASGRRTWRAAVTLPDLGEVHFIFDVIY